MQDREVVITGGTGGFGHHVTRTFVARGAKVTLSVQSSNDIDRMREFLGRDLERVRLVETDLRDETSVAALMARPEAVHALVHLVGGFAQEPLHEHTLATFQRLIDLNLTTAFLATKHALRRMLETGYGRIVAVASRAAVDPMPGLAVYGATKAAVLALMRGIAMDYKNVDITANAVLPSIVDTPANRTHLGDEQAPQWVSPLRLAETIAFLASEAAGDLRGTAVQAYARV